MDSAIQLSNNQSLYFCPQTEDGLINLIRRCNLSLSIAGSEFYKRFMTKRAAPAPAGGAAAAGKGRLEP